MKPYIALVVLLVGCAGDTKYTVANHTLVVKDSGYYTTAGYYCNGAAAGQLKLRFVDYNPICGATIAPDADGGARDAQLEHNELEIIYVTSAQDDPKLPFMVSVPDCNVGPAGPGIAYFRHFISGSTSMDGDQVSTASSGQLFLTSVDPTGKKPATGSFSLDFGADGKISGNFSTYTCN